MDSDPGAADVDANPGVRPSQTGPQHLALREYRQMPRVDLSRETGDRWALVGSRAGELLVATPDSFVEVLE